MKLKSLESKLSLHKNTVVNLNKIIMGNVKGGTDETGLTCDICNSDISCAVEKCDFPCTEP